MRTLRLVDLIKRCEAHRRGADSGAAKTAPCIAVAGATGFCAGNGRYARYVITIKLQFMILTSRRGCDRIGRTVRCGAVRPGHQEKSISTSALLHQQSVECCHIFGIGTTANFQFVSRGDSFRSTPLHMEK